MHSFDVISKASDEFLKELLEMQNKAYPEGWEYDDAEEYYRKMIENPSNLNIVLKEKEKLVGYVLAVPHNSAREELKDVDSQMEEDPECFYVETMEMLPEVQKTLGGGKLFFKMLGELIEESEKRGIHKFSMHARVATGLSKAVQKYFGNVITEVRRIENWPYYDGQESADYMLADVRNNR